MEITKTLDAKGLSCPMPIVRTKQAIDGLESGEILEMVTTDKGSKADVKAWAEATGNILHKMTENNGEFTFFIEKK